MRCLKAYFNYHQILGFEVKGHNPQSRLLPNSQKRYNNIICLETLEQEHRLEKLIDAQPIVSFPDCLSSAILKAIRAGVGWVWDRDYAQPCSYSGLHQTCNFGSRHPSKCACAHFTTNSFSPEYGRYVV